LICLSVYSTQQANTKNNIQKTHATGFSRVTAGLLPQKFPEGAAVKSTPRGEAVLLRVQLIGEIYVCFTIQQISKHQAGALQMTRVDLKIAPIQCAVRVVVINLALPLRILAPLNGERDTASRTKLSA